MAKAKPAQPAPAAPDATAPSIGHPADAPSGEEQSSPAAAAGDEAAALAPVNEWLLSGVVIQVRSVSKRGRRRAGRAFAPEPVEIAVGDLSPRELDAILADPGLVVTGLPDDEATPAA